MSKHLFVVAAGGTGAKVVEALVHLCAAGLGPEQLDILLLDVDQTNGNVERTQGTAEVYQMLARWDWSIQPHKIARNEPIPEAQVRFFNTRLRLHCCLEPIDMVRTEGAGAGGLEMHLRGQDGARNLLNLLYTESEQTSACKKGFLARPNLGSLILGGHLSQVLAKEDTGAASFKVSFASALSGASEKSPVPLVVIGSIFGGTGASLFPVACQRLRNAIAPADDPTVWRKVKPVAVMLAPYFLPNQANATDRRSEAETVDPSRFLADTANTLDHYTNTKGLDGYDAAYLIGNDHPGQNQLRFVEGATEQANPPFIEEVIGALAVLHGNSAPPGGGTRRRIYRPPQSDALDWQHLPITGNGAFRVALLLEFAAFTLLQAREGQPLSGGLLDACHQWSSEFELLPFYDRLLGSWARANFNHTYGRGDAEGRGWSRLSDQMIVGEGASASSATTPLAEYACRILHWARSALPSSDAYRLVKLGEDMDYQVVWELMCGVTEAEIAPAGHASGTNDNALVRLARIAAVALAKLATGQVPKRGIVNTSGTLPGFPSGHEGAKRPLGLPIDHNGMDKVSGSYGVDPNVHAKFAGTKLN